MERIGLYPGTFDPVTCGHLDIVRRAFRLVDRLVVGVAVSDDKRPLFSSGERVDMLREALADAELAAQVEPFDCLLVTFAKQVGASIILRGLRAVSDFEFEFQMVGMNRAIDQEIQTVFLMADPERQAIASKLVKEIARLEGDVSPFVPSSVASRLAVKFAEIASQ